MLIQEMHGSTWGCHTVSLPEARGIQLVLEARSGTRWMVDHIPGLLRLQTLIPVNATHVRRFAKHVGMQHEGTLRESLLRDGRLIDEDLFAFTRREILCLSLQ